MVEKVNPFIRENRKRSLRNLGKSKNQENDGIYSRTRSKMQKRKL